MAGGGPRPRGSACPSGRRSAAYYRSQFLNSALPGGVVGDVHRGVRHGLDAGDLSRGLRAVAWERTAGQVVFVGLALVALLVLDSPVHGAMTWIAPTAVVVGLCGALVRAGAAAPRRVAAGADRPHGARRRPRRPARPARVAGRRPQLASSWPSATAPSSSSRRGPPGTDASLARLLPLAMLVLLAMVVPLNVGGWGPREGMAAWAFAAAGLGAEQGVAAATAYGVMGLVATLPGAVVLAVDALRRRRAPQRADVVVDESVPEPRQATSNPSRTSSPAR